MSSAPIRAVLFDLDGTLVHTHIDFDAMRREALRLARDAGVDAEPFRERDVLGLLNEAAALLPEPAEFLRQADEALVRIELEACERATEAPGARELLQSLLDAGVRVGIVTRNSPQAVARVLEAIPLPHEVLLTRADTPRVKPDPVHLLLALERLDAAPETALMVGDHAMDILGGKAAGMCTLGIETPVYPVAALHAAAPDGVIRHLSEMRPWIFL